MKKTGIITIVFFALTVAVMLSCEKKSDAEKENEALSKYLRGLSGDYETIEDGIYRIKKRSGTGEKLKNGDLVYVFYTGMLINEKDTFDTNIKGDDPFLFRLGAGDVISGWDRALEGMYIGDSIRLILHSRHAYGSTRVSSIPPYSSLIFDISITEAPVVEKNK